MPGAAIDRLVALARHDRVAVLCLEAEEARCHRQVVLEMVVGGAPEIETLTLF